MTLFQSVDADVGYENVVDRQMSVGSGVDRRVNEDEVVRPELDPIVR